MDKMAQAFDGAVKAYFSGMTPVELDAVLGKERKYTKAYFDKLEKDLGLDSERSDDEIELREGDAPKRGRPKGSKNKPKEY